MEVYWPPASMLQPVNVATPATCAATVVAQCKVPVAPTVTAASVSVTGSVELRTVTCGLIENVLPGAAVSGAALNVNSGSPAACGVIGRTPKPGSASGSGNLMPRSFPNW